MRIVLSGTRKDFKSGKEPRDRDRRNNDDTRAGSGVEEKRPADGSGSEAFKSKKALRTLLTVLQEMEE